MRSALLGFPLGRGLDPATYDFPLGERQVLSSLFPPVDDYYAWYDTRDPAYIGLNGTAVEWWYDRSGHEMHLAAVTTARPTYGTRLINGILVLDFDGVLNRLDVSGFTIDMSSSAFIVAVTDAVASMALWGTTANGGLNTYVLSGTDLRTDTANVVTLGTQGNADVVSGTPFAAARILTPTSVKHRLNGVSEIDAHASAASGLGTFVLGFYPTAGFRLNGAIAECIIYDRTVTEREEEETMRYLKHKWGTP